MDKSSLPYRLYTTQEVCTMVSMARQSLANLMVIHPELRPTSSNYKSGKAKLVWTDADVIRLAQFRLTGKIEKGKRS